MLVEFRVLGPLELHAGGRSIDLGGPRQRRILAALLLHPNQVVSMARLGAVGWDTDPPATAGQQVRNRIGALRAILTRVGCFIDTVEDGYRLRLNPGELDAQRFAELVERGRATADTRVLREALGLWRGPVLDGLECPALAAEVEQLVEQRLTAWEDCLQRELADGLHADALTDLTALTAEYPLREPLVGLLMTALDRIDPSPELRRRFQELSAPPAPVRTPAQLPADARGFAGRSAEMAQLDDLLMSGRPVVISAIGGTAGVGKTALAVHWAQRVRHHYPDGQLYINLRGFDPDGAIVGASQALRRFLNALGVPPNRIPTDLERQVELYRATVADKRLLVVLDNARDAHQVIPLLPGNAGSSILVTSRDPLSELVSRHGAHPLTLGLLTDAEARAMLAGRIGDHAVAADPTAVELIIARCARLPLALAIAAARYPDHTLAAVARALERAGSRLDAFAGDDAATDVRAVFSWSYQLLSPPAARLFRLLGLHPGPDFAVPAAASIAGVAADELGPLLAELAGARLLDEQLPGRYSVHDLLHAYAAELAATDDEREPARHRMLDHYLHSAHAAASLVNPERSPISLPSPQPDTSVVTPPARDDAVAWLSAEQPVLTALPTYAADHGLDRYPWQLAWSMSSYLGRLGHWADWLAVHTTALEVAERTGDREGLAHAHHGLGAVHNRMGHVDASIANLQCAAALFHEIGDVVREGDCHYGLTASYDDVGDYPAALRHGLTGLELYRRAGHGAAVSLLGAVGFIRVRLGDYARAIETLHEALRQCEETGELDGRGSTWDSLGWAHAEQGEHAEAVDCFRTAVGFHREVHSRYELADTLFSLGNSELATGNVAAARAAWEEALVIFDQLGHPQAGEVRQQLAGLGNPIAVR
jgi:DNA-binding SARP family transcriptional activator/tetratricopeptide (TPR) repeat protein